MDAKMSEHTQSTNPGLLLFESTIKALMSSRDNQVPESVRQALAQLQLEWKSLNEWEMLAISDSAYKRILDIAGIPASSLSHGDKQRQISQFIHRISCEPDTRSRVKESVPSREQAQVIMDHLQDTLDQHRGRRHPERGQVLKLLQDISDISDNLPKKLWLTGGVRDIRHFDTGGEADIDVGEYNGAKVACRSIRTSGYDGDPIETRKAVRREIIAQRQMRHDNVLEIIGVISRGQHEMSIISPFMKDGRAIDFLKKQKGCDPFLRIMQGVVEGIAYLHCHDPSIIHGDICARNILVHDGRAIVADFGFTRIRHEKNRTMTAKAQECLSLRHRAPERVNSQTNDFDPTVSADIYALSMTLLELATLDVAFAEYEDANSASAAAAREERPEQPSSLANLGFNSRNRLYNILQSMWKHEPEQRREAHKVVGDLKSLAQSAAGSAGMVEARDAWVSDAVFTASPTQSPGQSPFELPMRLKPRNPNLQPSPFLYAQPIILNGPNPRTIKYVACAKRSHTAKSTGELSFNSGEEVGVVGEREGMLIGIVMESGEWKKELSDSDKPKLFPKSAVRIIAEVKR